MANIPASGASARSQHATLTAGQVDVVTLDRGYAWITVQNWDATTPLYFTLTYGDNDQTALTPTVGGAGTFRVNPGSAWEVRDDQLGSVARGGTPPPSVAQLIATGAVAYSVTGTNHQ